MKSCAESSIDSTFAVTGGAESGAPFYADRFSAFAQSLTLAAVPQDVGLRVKACILDVLGICLASARMDYMRMVNGVFMEMGGKPEASVLGWDVMLPMANAALLNGSMSHGTDFDDSHPTARMHPSSVIVSAALAVAQARGSTGTQLLEAVLVGLECMIRIGNAGESEDGFHHRGLHPTTLCGVFGAALAASRLLGLDARQCSWAQGLAGNMASGSTQFLADGSWGKRIGAGWAAHGGIIAAQLALRGFTGPRSIYEGQWGLFKSHLRESFYDLQMLDRGLGSIWETQGLSARRYPCCARAPTHVSLALELLAEHKFDPAEIVSIECLVDRMAESVMCEPWAEKLAPATGYAAKFSLPYCIAAALHCGRLTMAEFDGEMVHNCEIAALMRTVRYRVEPGFDPAHYPGAVVIRMRDNRVFERTRLVAVPLAWPELRTKFLENAAPVLGIDRAAHVADMVLALETQPQASDLLAACAVPA